MSSPHENTVWQSPDGTWNIGMHPDDRYDFDHTSFEWVSTGHKTSQEAMAAWDGANPGSHFVVPYDPANPESVERVAECEDMAAIMCETAAERVAEARARGTLGVSTGSSGTFYADSLGYHGYRGPVKHRSLRSLGRARNDTERAAYSYPLNGQPNPYADQVKAAQKKVEQRLASATDAEKRDYLDVQKERRDGLTQMLAEHRARQERQRRANASSVGMYRGYDAKAAQRQAERRQIIDDAVQRVEKQIAAIDATRAKQEAEFFPPAPAKKSAGRQGRVSKGVPTGGQFAASQRDEPDVRL